MNPVRLTLPPGCEIYNFLYRTRHPEYLVQDQLSIALPNGFFIDVGWFPEHDPTGEYIIRVFYEYWNDQKIIPIQTRDIDEAVRTVEDLAQHFNQQQILTSSSDTTQLTLEPA